MEMHMQLETRFGIWRITNERGYSFGSEDNARSYDSEVRLEGVLTSVHGVEVDGRRVIVFGAGGGCSTVHQQSAVAVDDRLYLAVGGHAVCLSMVPPYTAIWARRVDFATCFGLFWEGERRALLSRGELQITRLSPDGDEIWSAFGADIFTEGFRLLPDYIEAVDFNHVVYRFDYETGREIT